MENSNHLSDIPATSRKGGCKRLLEEHAEQFHSFCEDAGQPICFCCEHSPYHRAHNQLKNAHLGCKGIVTASPTSSAHLQSTVAMDFGHSSSSNDSGDKKDTLSGCSDVTLEEPEAVSSEPHAVSSDSELNCELREKLKTYQVSVILDPGTAHDDLILSEDLRKVTYGRDQEKKLRTCRRFSVLPCVLGCEIFTSGRHYFEVNVGAGAEYDLGVCLENVPRDTDGVLEPQSGFWVIKCPKKNHINRRGQSTSRVPRAQSLIVGVYLDYEAGRVSFYNMTSGSHIYTFPKASFSGTLRPFFRAYRSSLSLLPSDEEGT